MQTRTTSRGAGASTEAFLLSPLALVLAALVAGGLPLLALGSEERTSTPRTVEIVASRYAFDPARIEVREGEHVKLVLRSADTTHGLAIDGYGVKVPIPKGGEEVSVEFMAHRPGTFRMKCSEYCGSGHRRMQGRFVVTGAPK
ncbi:MAG: cupredoxin domain-containing protein [Acidobacteriota bacterium]